MGFYLRKSISVGPLRFNLSKSGVGVSAGIKGFRVGAGPRGNYVHMGRGGLYYRATIPSNIYKKSKSVLQSRVDAQPIIPDDTHDPLQEIDSAEACQIVDSSSRELLDELSQKSKSVRLWPFALVVSSILILSGLFYAWPKWLLIPIAILSVVGIYAAYVRDLLSKTVVVFYEFDSDLEKHYESLHSAATALASASAIWHIEASGRVRDRKYHAGASSLVRRKSTFVRRAMPPYVKTNVETVAIGVGQQVLHFFPDRVLIYDSKGVGAVSYQELIVQVNQTRFIEDASVPRDAKIVGRTWKYVNKSGRPDKRFKDNREIPICLYEEIALSSSTGLNELLNVSVCGVGAAFASSINELGRTIQSIDPR